MGIIAAITPYRALKEIERGFPGIPLLLLSMILKGDYRFPKIFSEITFSIGVLGTIHNIVDFNAILRKGDSKNREIRNWIFLTHIAATALLGISIFFGIKSFKITDITMTLRLILCAKAAYTFFKELKANYTFLTHSSDLDRLSKRKEAETEQRGIEELSSDDEAESADVRQERTYKVERPPEPQVEEEVEPEPKAEPQAQPKERLPTSKPLAHAPESATSALVTAENEKVLGSADEIRLGTLQTEISQLYTKATSTEPAEENFTFAFLYERIADINAKLETFFMQNEDRITVDQAHYIRQEFKHTGYQSLNALLIKNGEEPLPPPET